SFSKTQGNYTLLFYLKSPIEKINCMIRCNIWQFYDVLASVVPTDFDKRQNSRSSYSKFVFCYSGCKNSFCRPTLLDNNHFKNFIFLDSETTRHSCTGVMARV